MSLQCIAPHELQEGDLMAYLEDLASPEVAGHIERCPACAAEVESLRRVEARFIAALDRASCPAPDALLQYEAGLLSTVERRQVEHHVRTCARCQHELGQLALPDLQVAGPSLIERVRQTGRQLITALLVPAPQPALSLRGTDQRRLFYQAGDYQIVLAITPPMLAEQIWQIEGQVVGTNVELMQTGSASLLLSGASVASDTVDESGFFALDQVGSGRYTLQIELPDTSILIEAVDLT